MPTGDAKLDVDGIRLLQDDGEQRIESDDDDCCCGCWRIAQPCNCDFSLSFNPVLYVPCSLVTGVIIFKRIGPVIGPSDLPICYVVSTNSIEVDELPVGTTEYTDLSITFDTCGDCCDIQACCLLDPFKVPTGDCLDLSVIHCLIQGGKPQGIDTNCQDPDLDCDSIETEACCDPETSDCEDLIPHICELQGGIPMGKGTNCDNTNCPPQEDCSANNCIQCDDFYNVVIVGFQSSCNQAGEGPCICNVGESFNVCRDLVNGQDGPCTWRCRLEVPNCSDPIEGCVFGASSLDQGFCSENAFDDFYFLNFGVLILNSTTSTWILTFTITSGCGNAPIVQYEYHKTCIGISDCPLGVYNLFSEDISSGDDSCVITAPQVTVI